MSQEKEQVQVETKKKVFVQIVIARTWSELEGDLKLDFFSPTNTVQQNPIGKKCQVDTKESWILSRMGTQHQTRPGKRTRTLGKNLAKNQHILSTKKSWTFARFLLCFAPKLNSHSAKLPEFSISRKNGKRMGKSDSSFLFWLAREKGPIIVRTTITRKNSQGTAISSTKVYPQKQTEQKRISFISSIARNYVPFETFRIHIPWWIHNGEDSWRKWIETRSTIKRTIKIWYFPTRKNKKLSRTFFIIVPTFAPPKARARNFITRI